MVAFVRVVATALLIALPLATAQPGSDRDLQPPADLGDRSAVLEAASVLRKQFPDLPTDIKT